jgi:hypothetical protein
VTDERRVPPCDRTQGLVDRVVAERVTAEDRTHAGTCDQCGRVLLRSARFDDELRRAARGFVAEQLPSGVLDPGLAPLPVAGIRPTRHAAASLASIVAAVVILVVGTSVALAPGGAGPSASPQGTGLQFSVPVLRGMVDIMRDVEAMGYSCVQADATPSTGPTARPDGPRSAECLAPKSLEGATVAVSPVQTAGDKVVYVTIFGALDRASTVMSPDGLAEVMGNLASLSISDPQVASDVRAFVIETLPGLQVAPSADDVLVTYGSVRVYLQRTFTGDYRVILQPV